jgi:hypothetical protein
MIKSKLNKPTEEDSEMNKEERIIFLTAQNQAIVNRQFVSNLKVFVKSNQVTKAYVFAVKGKSVLDNKEVYVGGMLVNEGKFGPHATVLSLSEELGIEVEIVPNTPRHGVQINENLSYFHNQMLPQVVDPFRGLAPKLRRTSSFIVNATKVRFEVLGTNNPKAPRTIMSTGSLTNARYNVEMQTGVKALEMHTFGFTYVEIYDKKRFHAHPVIGTQSGGFSYLQWKYTNGVRTTNKVKALILGDIHRAVSDKDAMAEGRSQIRLLKPKTVVLHDFHDGQSVNHHECKSFLSRIKRRVMGYDKLEDELKGDLLFLNKLAKGFPKQKFLIAESNHDQFIMHYINSEQFMKDPQNVLFISRLLGSIVDNPKRKPILQLALELVGTVAVNVKFMRHDDEVRIGGKLVSMHGHKGMSGARGSPATFEKSNIGAVTGHTHNPSLYSNGMVVGHNTDIELQDYAKGGISKWLQANGVIDELNKNALLVLKNNFK